MHTVQVRAIDGDGASSEAKQGTLMVHNVPPTVTGLIPYEAVIEDNPLELTVVPDDTPSDMETLEVCWDLDAKFDADNDGEADNDCEKTGASIVASWPTESNRCRMRATSGAAAVLYRPRPHDACVGDERLPRMLPHTQQ